MTIKLAGTREASDSPAAKLKNNRIMVQIQQQITACIKYNLGKINSSSAILKLRVRQEIITRPTWF
jgi:hypothetical protein